MSRRGKSWHLLDLTDVYHRDGRPTRDTTCDSCQAVGPCGPRYGCEWIGAHRSYRTWWVCDTCCRREVDMSRLTYGMIVRRTVYGVAHGIAPGGDYGRVVGFSRDGHPRVMRDGLKTVSTYSPRFWEPAVNSREGT